MGAWTKAHGQQCASADCGSTAVWHYDAGGVGSDYCDACRDRIDDHLVHHVFFDDADAHEGDDDWDELMCSMGVDGQCGQAGSEYCDFECPTMRARRVAPRQMAKD